MNDHNSNEDIIQRLRERFLIECQEKKEAFHQIDVSRVRTDDWQIQRFLLLHQNEEQAYEMLVKALHWKKSFGVHDRNDHYFPKEFFEWTEVHCFGRSNEGRLLLWEKTRHNRKIPELNLLVKQFSAHIMEKIDTSESREGFTVVTDTNGSGLNNANMDVIKFKIELNRYYPFALRSNLVVDLPIILSGIAKIILSLSDQRLKDNIYYIKSKDLTKFMDPGVIPVELGGKREVKLDLPENLQSMKELSQKLGLNEKVVETYYQSFGQQY